MYLSIYINISMNVCLYVKIFEWWEQFLFFLFSSFFFFFFLGSTHWFSILLAVLPTFLSSFFRAWKTEERINSSSFLAFSLSTKFFFYYALPGTAHARLEKIFSSIFPSLSLPPFYRQPHHYQHYFQPRQCVTITYLWRKKNKCKNICMYLSILSTFFLCSEKGKYKYIKL
jgi:hypothetical protein